MSQAAADAAKLALKDTDALELINTDMIPALDEVGKGFEAGTVFLPQLLMSAEAAKAAFAVVKESMEASGEVQEKKGKVILATVKGDIHDIGKNIVKVLLENYSFDVMDLGRDVPPETIVEAAVKEHVPVVGLKCPHDDNGSGNGRHHQGAPEGCTMGEGYGWRCSPDTGVCRCHRGGYLL